MRRLCSILLIALFLFAPLLPVLAADDAAPKESAYAAEKAEAEKAVDKAADKTDGLRADVKKARELILGRAGDNAFGRGLLVALFEPVFLASMFCLGLWAGQMSDRLSNIWMLPIFAFGATLIGAFITAYHSDWKPHFGGKEGDMLASLGSTEAVAVVVGLAIGAVVGMQLVVAPFFAIAGVAVAGLLLGFSQTAELGAHKNALLPFWAGFSLTGLLINIFGIGFETFLQSINLKVLTRWAGFATLALSFAFGTKIF